MTMIYSDPEQTTLDRDLVKKLVYGLSTRERLILGWRYGFFGGKRTYRAIAKTLSLSPARCHEIETKALGRMWNTARTHHQIFNYLRGRGLPNLDEFFRLDLQRRLRSLASQNRRDPELEQIYTTLMQRRDRLN